MKFFLNQQCKQTPQISCIPKTHHINIAGNSYMNNAYEFYEPIKKWLKSYCEHNLNNKISISLELIILNSMSSVVMFEIFEILNEFHKEGAPIEISWYYDEENDMALESGQDYKNDFKELDFNLISKSYTKQIGA